MKYSEQITYYSKLAIHKTDQLTFNCSNSTIETQEKGAKYVQS